MRWTQGGRARVNLREVAPIPQDVEAAGDGLHRHRRLRVWATEQGVGGDDRFVLVNLFEASWSSDSDLPHQHIMKNLGVRRIWDIV